jgi:hypothetical protein
MIMMCQGIDFHKISLRRPELKEKLGLVRDELLKVGVILTILILI